MLPGAQTAQASSSYVNNVAAGRAPNTYSPYDANGNVYSYYNSSYDTGKIPSADAPRVKDVDPGNVEYCDKNEAARKRLEEYNRQEASAIAGAEEYLAAIINPAKEDLKYQEGLNGTYAIGVEGVAAHYGRGSYGIQLVADRKGNVAIVRYVTGGAGTTTTGVSLTLTKTDAETISDLAGPGYSAGETIAWVGKETMGGDGYSGTTYAVGALTIPEGHAEGTYSTVTDITSNVDHLGLRPALNWMLEQADKLN